MNSGNKFEGGPSAAPQTEAVEKQEANLEPQEIERKFLVRELPEGLLPEQGEEISQGYLAIGTDGTEVRLRKRGDKYYQTVKTAGDAVRNEWEIEMAKEQFESLWPASDGKRLEKTRYKIPYEDVVIELDIFGGQLTGLEVAEVEFASEAAAAEFIPPAWLGEDVTAEKSFKNKNLIGLNPEKIKDIIERS